MQGSINFDGSLIGNITGGGGGGGDTVVITPVVTSGTKIADVSVNGVEKDLYCPTPPTPPEIDITPVVTSGTKIADVSLNGVEKDLYAPNPTTVNVTQLQQSGTKIATINVNGVSTDLYAPESSGDVYSSDEVEDGTWFGEKIYRKSFQVTLSSTTNYIDVRALNIKNIIKVEGAIKGNNNYQISFPYYENNNYYANFNYDETDARLAIFTGSQMPTYYTQYKITIYYTKNVRNE